MGGEEPSRARLPEQGLGDPGAMPATKGQALGADPSGGGREAVAQKALLPPLDSTW